MIPAAKGLKYLPKWCRRWRFCRGLHRPASLALHCLLDGEAYDSLCHLSRRV